MNEYDIKIAVSLKDVPPEKRSTVAARLMHNVVEFVQDGVEWVDVEVVEASIEKAGYR